MNLLLCIIYNQNMSILIKNKNLLDYFIYHEEKKYLLDNKKQNNKTD